MIIEHLRGGYMNNGSVENISHIKCKTSISMSNWGDSTILKDCKSNMIKNTTVVMNSYKINSKIKNQGKENARNFW